MELFLVTGVPRHPRGFALWGEGRYVIGNDGRLCVEEVLDGDVPGNTHARILCFPRGRWAALWHIKGGKWTRCSRSTVAGFASQSPSVEMSRYGKLYAANKHERQVAVLVATNPAATDALAVSA